VRTILAQLDEARTIEDVRITSFNLHPLKGNMKGLWSVTVRQLADCFQFRRWQRRRG
jgi:hypothetical protein